MCLSVCLHTHAFVSLPVSISQKPKNHKSRPHQILYACCLVPSSWYVMYFQFCWWRQRCVAATAASLQCCALANTPMWWRESGLVVLCAMAAGGKVCCTIFPCLKLHITWFWCLVFVMLWLHTKRSYFFILDSDNTEFSDRGY